MSAAPPPWARATVLGHPLDPIPLDAAARWTVRAARERQGARVVTLNPEIVVRALHDPALGAAVRAADLVVPDGVGVVWAARRAGVAVPGRVPGVDLAAAALHRGGRDLAVYLLGGRPGVAQRAAEAARERYGVQVAGADHGYFGEADEDDVVARVAAARPHLLLVGLGERQETFLARHQARLAAGVAMGVGGTLDVLAGEAERTPAWTRRAGLEWAWRVGLDRRRWHRAPRLARFVLHVWTGR